MLNMDMFSFLFPNASSLSSLIEADWPVGWLTGNLTGVDGMDTNMGNTVFRITTFIWSLVMMICCLIGAFGNVMSLIIFTRLSMRRLSVNVLLTGLSSVDLAIVVLSVPVFAVNSLNDYILDQTLFEAFYSIVLLVLYPMSLISQTCSIYTFVLISIERYYAVCRPLIVKRLLTVGRARLAQLLLFIFAISYNFIRFFEYRASSDPLDGYYKPRLRYDRSYFVVYYTTLYLLTQFLIPFTIITTLNVLILRRLRRARQERQRLSHAQLDQCRTTRMVIVVTVLFAMCNVLPFIVNIWEAFDRNLFKKIILQEWNDPIHLTEMYELDTVMDTVTDAYYSNPTLIIQSSDFKTSIAYLILDIANTLVVVNAASTFIVYLIYCRRYRRLFWEYCSFRTNLCSKRVGHSPANTNSSYWSSYIIRQRTISISDNINTSNILVPCTEFRQRSNCVSHSMTSRRYTTAEGRKPEKKRLNRGRRSMPCPTAESSIQKAIPVTTRATVSFATASEVLFG